jgi:hypothetical protein
MNAPQLMEVLTRLGMSRDGESFHCPAAHLVTVYLGLGSEPLIIDRVAKIEILGELLVFTGMRKERYASVVSAVLAVRIASDSK